MTMVTRIAQPTEAAALASLISLAYRVEDFFVDGDRTNAGEVRMKMAHGAFLVMEDASGLAGSVYVERRGERAYFGMLSIHPERQKQGLGRTLVNAAESHARGMGCALMEIDVVNLRTELPPFYRKLGYTLEGERPFPDGHRVKLPCHLLVMTKPLSGDSTVS